MSESNAGMKTKRGRKPKFNSETPPIPTQATVIPPVPVDATPVEQEAPSETSSFGFTTMFDEFDVDEGNRGDDQLSTLEEEPEQQAREYEPQMHPRNPVRGVIPDPPPFVSSKKLLEAANSFSDLYRTFGQKCPNNDMEPIATSEQSIPFKTVTINEGVTRHRIKTKNYAQYLSMVRRGFPVLVTKTNKGKTVAYYVQESQEETLKVAAAANTWLISATTFGDTQSHYQFTILKDRAEAGKDIAVAAVDVTMGRELRDAKRERAEAAEAKDIILGDHPPELHMGTIVEPPRNRQRREE
jgi:antitoxin (DNA-binding transcriptional repressor) of toxin-antitoxin stability system